MDYKNYKNKVHYQNTKIKTLNYVKYILSKLHNFSCCAKQSFNTFFFFFLSSKPKVIEKRTNMQTHSQVLGKVFAPPGKVFERTATNTNWWPEWSHQSSPLSLLLSPSHWLYAYYVFRPLTLPPFFFCVSLVLILLFWFCPPRKHFLQIEYHLQQLRAFPASFPFHLPFFDVLLPSSFV